MKEKIRLTNGILYEIDSISYHFNKLKIIFDENVDVNSLVKNTSIFDSIEILTRGGITCGEYDGYNTVYNYNENALILSNDGSVYRTPVETPPVEIEPYIPTLADSKALKINMFNGICEKMIVAGVDVDIDGVTEHFSYDLEDQNNIKNALDLALSTNMDVPLHCDGGKCKLYSVEDVVKIYVAQMTNLTHHQTYYNQIKSYINSLENIETVESLNYGDELTGEYLENYNMIMTQANTIVNVYLNGGIE